MIHHNVENSCWRQHKGFETDNKNICWWLNKCHIVTLKNYVLLIKGFTGHQMWGYGGSGQVQFLPFFFFKPMFLWNREGCPEIWKNAEVVYLKQEIMLDPSKVSIYLFVCNRDAGGDAAFWQFVTWYSDQRCCIHISLATAFISFFIQYLLHTIFFEIFWIMFPSGPGKEKGGSTEMLSQTQTENQQLSFFLKSTKV